MIKPSLQFVFDLLVQQAGGLDKQDDEQDDERECITVGSGDVGRANGFDDAQDDAAQQGTPQVADAAQDSSGEGFHTDGGAHVNTGVGQRGNHDTGNAGQCRADTKSEEAHVGDVDTHHGSALRVRVGKLHALADLDFGKIKLYVGNYDFWKQSSELAARLQADRNAKAEEKIKELQEFVARFSANASKSKQATSRKKMLDKIELEEIVPSSRKYPFINFKAEREIGNDLLTVENLTVKMDGETILDNISFILRPGDKTAIIGQNDIQTTALIRALADDIDYEGTIKWGVTTSRSYLPKDNSKDFASGESILEWLRQFAEKGEDDDTFLCGFLGRMLFSGDEVNKSVSVLSGGEKVRVMLSKLMLLKSNVLLLDDPTNHLDLESISSLNDGVRDFKESVIFASHDHEFIQTIANHIVVVSKNGVIDRIDETYDEFLENEEVQAKVKALWAD